MRIGWLPYINSLPLTYGLGNGVVKEPPAVLAAMLRSGVLDVALAPSAALFDDSSLSIVPGMCIGSDGPVRSVRLFHARPVEKIRKVAVDVESRTAALLVRVILSRKYGVDPEYVRSSEMKLIGNSEGFDAELLIGDKALRHNEDLDSLDLGAEWKELTGLPFVYAFWVVREGFRHAGLTYRLRRSKEAGQENIDGIVGSLGGYDEGMLREYFTRNIEYDLDEEKLRGFRKYNSILCEMGLVPEIVDVREYGEEDIREGARR